MRRLLAGLLSVACAACATSSALIAADWPTARGDAARSGFTSDAIDPNPTARWIYRAHRPAPAWPTSSRQPFDRAHHVVVAAGKLVVASTVDGSVEMLDATSGAPRWRVVTDAPVRVAPAIWKNRVFVASDDGWLRALDLETGALRWKQVGGPRDASPEMVLANDALAAMRPARGGPAIAGGVIYWASGIWPSDGVVIHANDAETGAEIWRNDTDGARFMPQPHGGANAYSGLSAQGHLVVDDDLLLVPTGRAVPAALTRADGRFAYFWLQKYGHAGGTSVVALGAMTERSGDTSDGGKPLRTFHDGGQVYDSASGVAIAKLPGRVARFASGIVEASDDAVRVLRWAAREKPNRKGEIETVHELDLVRSTPLAGRKFEVIVAASTAVIGAEDRVHLLDVATGTLSQTLEVRGNAWSLAVAGGWLWVSTDEGFVHAFAPRRADGEANADTTHTATPRALPPHDERWADAAHAILAAGGVRAGYCVDLGCEDGSLAIELARQSDLRVYCVDDDAARVEATRARLDRAGLLGTRVVVHHRELARTTYPRYFANLVVSSRSMSSAPGELATDIVAEATRIARPWGGTLALGPTDTLRVERRGPLEGAGSWTHQYADPANTCCSSDARVQGPLRMLWFRDADLRVPQRHGRAPAPLFHEGYLIVEGLDAVRASDAYNGRTLWEFPLPGILAPYDQDHLMGAAGTGSNLCVGGGGEFRDSVFVHRGTHCLRLDLATGELLAEFAAPPLLAKPAGGSPAPRWGYLAWVDGILYGTLADTEHLVKWRYLKGDMNGMFSESRVFFAMDAASGEVLWHYQAKQSIRHNSIAIGGGRVYLIDRELAAIDGLGYEERAGASPPAHAHGELLALDARSGEVVWREANEVFGTMLAVDVEHGALLMSYQPTRFRLPSETGGRLAVFHTKNGYRLWDKEAAYASRPLLIGTTIYAQGGAWDLESGVERPFPFERSYGCGVLAASEKLLVYRSATMGYWDLGENRENRNYGGLRLGCWINAIPAGGIVLVPDGSGGCECSYLNQAALALQPAE